jgi:hypothetical protein
MSHGHDPDINVGSVVWKELRKLARWATTEEITLAVRRTIEDYEIKRCGDVLGALKQRYLVLHRSAKPGVNHLGAKGCTTWWVDPATPEPEWRLSNGQKILRKTGVRPRAEHMPKPGKGVHPLEAIWPSPVKIPHSKAKPRVHMPWARDA